jgi:cytochrome c553
VPISKNFLIHQVIFVSLMLISSAVFADELKQREQAADQVSEQFIKQLGGHLKKEMQANGPVQAINVCKEIAPEIANQLSIENGWSVSRVTTKTRNSLLGTTDMWEREALAEFEAAAAKGEKYSEMKKIAVVDEDGQFYFRYMKPLAIKPVCLTCHGSEDQIPAPVKTELEKLYPYDQAKGYKQGELRGAVSIKQPMDVPLYKKF